MGKTLSIVSEQSFELSDVFEDLVDWPKRLAGEEPFFGELFRRAGVKSVLDTACGTGHHAALFHRWGLSVEGADISARMIEKARALHGEPEGLCWKVRGYDDLSGPDERFDCAVCIGNSLAMAPGKETARRAIGAMLSAVRPGGVVVVHLLNFAKIPEGAALWQKCRRADSPEGEALIVKGVHHCGDRAWVELLLAPVAKPEKMKTAHLPLVVINAKELEEMMIDAGAKGVDLFGGYGGQPYEREKSTDLVAVAFRKDV